ncbi:CAP domain-containing protein [Lutibacter sp.]
MKTIYFKLALFIIISSTVFTSCAKEDDGIYFNEVNEIKVSYSKIEFEILDLVNKHRNSIGLQSLNKLDVISSVAQSHTSYMVETGNVNHYNFSKRQENLVVNANAKTVGENVAYGFNSAEGVVEAWLKSESHRALIENNNYTHFGISTKKNIDGRNYFTQMFIKR